MTRTDRIEPNVILGDIVFKNWGLTSPLSTSDVDIVTSENDIKKPMGVAFTGAGTSTSGLTFGYGTMYRENKLIDVLFKVSIPMGRKDADGLSKDRRWSLVEHVKDILRDYDKGIIPRHEK